MKETVLVYNFTERDRVEKLKRALLPMRVKVRNVKREEFLQPIGFLAGLKEIEANGGSYGGEGFSDEMLVMAGFTSAKVDELIAMLRKHGVGRVNYKAILTPTNQNWNSLQLFDEIKMEHEKMSSMENK